MADAYEAAYGAVLAERWPMVEAELLTPRLASSSPIVAAELLAGSSMLEGPAD
jgi:hypothetical protein